MKLPVDEKIGKMNFQHKKMLKISKNAEKEEKNERTKLKATLREKVKPSLLRI
jgi:hypothetical protein